MGTVIRSGGPPSHGRGPPWRPSRGSSAFSSRYGLPHDLPQTEGGAPATAFQIPSRPPPNDDSRAAEAGGGRPSPLGGGGVQRKRVCPFGRRDSLSPNVEAGLGADHRSFSAAPCHRDLPWGLQCRGGPATVP